MTLLKIFSSQSVLLAAFCLFIFSLTSVQAKDLTRQERNKFGNVPPFATPLAYDKGLNMDAYLNNKFDPPQIPPLSEVKFLKQPDSKSISQKIDRLVHGISIDIRPEYDHFGYEIRRKMSNILNPENLSNLETIKAEAINIKKARTILDFWKKDLLREIGEIELELKAMGRVNNLNSAFRYNKRIVNTFIAEAYEWMDENLEYLEILQNLHGDYLVRYPLIYFSDNRVKARIIKYYNSREEALKVINQYSPFRSMLY